MDIICDKPSSFGWNCLQSEAESGTCRFPADMKSKWISSQTDRDLQAVSFFGTRSKVFDSFSQSDKRGVSCSQKI